MRTRPLTLPGVATALLCATASPAHASVQPGTTYSGEGTFYGATGVGNCLYDATGDIGIAALNHTDYETSRMCGAYLQVKGPRGEITVKIVDRCPECGPGDIDLGERAFARIADPVAGRVPITWKLVSPDIGGTVAYRYKEGSTQWWCGIQVRNHRNPVATLEVRTGSTWRQLPRREWNYFVSEDGTGCGSDIRVTDIHGQTLTDTGIAIRPNVDQPGRAQFGMR
ncbi:expansin EXLX1 family cellulose-binding protein [Streptomyces phyllanthi]|uniref:Lipoprotein A-like protein n=1 Tax=Streptomyces phyllanthi TaxID=1803180 RepID=A0A5N8W3M7_9ACTN|nr:expansin EXLX1 family cellulose-binding protein [Streptomyces phyllanthi]MPY40904.1 lipoprotein A-like protein [Streptomyces phyllanthi]